MKKVILLTIALLLVFAVTGESQTWTFDNNVDGWTPVNGTVDWYSGTLQLTRVSGTSQYVYHDAETQIGRRYKYMAYVKSGTSGDESGRLYARLNTTPVYSSIALYTTSDTWLSYSVEFVALSTLTRLYLDKYTDTDGTMLWDTVMLTLYPFYKIYYTETAYDTYDANSYTVDSNRVLTIKKDGTVLAIYKEWYRLIIE